MKSRLTFAALTLVLSIVLMTGISFAESLTLTKIGTFDLGGKKYSEWWYSGINPTFYGKADNGDEVELIVNNQSYKDVANVAGDWDIPVALAKGDYQVSIKSGDLRYNFLLHLGQEFGSTSTTTQSSSSTASVPSTGAEQTTALTLGLGVSLLALYLYFFDANKKHKVFEKKIVSDN
jgi:LPXTG-motif cell wall-anchored protein